MAKKKEKDKDESQGQIAWETAEVTSSNLTVEIDGEVSKAWGNRVAEMVDRLARSPEWDELKVSNGTLKVTAVPQGHESELRHVLEGAVQQANADFAPDPESDDDDGASSEDAEMAATFQSFAEREPDETTA